MWFDVQQALANLAGGDMPPSPFPPATTATLATKPTPTRPRVAVVASVAAPQARNPQLDTATDAETFADLLATSGPTTYGAVAVALGWGATRAWQAEARLRAAGRVQYDAGGRTTIQGRQVSLWPLRLSTP